MPETTQQRQNGISAKALVQSIPAASTNTPPAVLLHYCILLTGFGTVFLGPMLPALTTTLHLSDRGAGALLAAQFTGAFLGGWTTTAPLHRSMVRGLSAAFAGFTSLATATLLTSSLLNVLLPLAMLGFGIGQTITSVNLLASAKWSHRRGAALNLLNFSWSFGALTAPLLLLRLLHSTRVSTLLYGFAALLLVGLIATLLQTRTATIMSAETTVSAVISESTDKLPPSVYLFFGLLLFLYGGVETSLSGWLTTFDHRYSAAAGWHGTAVSTAAFWASLTAARLLTPFLLRKLSELLLLRLGLGTATVGLLLMLLAHGTLAIAVCAAVIGLSLSPWFPLVLSVLVSRRPTASQAGRVIAVSGLGAAALPYLVGLLSASAGSLRVALTLPVLGAMVLLMLTWSTLFTARQPASAPS